MKYLILLFLLTSCNEAMKDLTPDQQQQVRDYMENKNREAVPVPEKLSNNQALEVTKEKVTEYSNNHTMNCTNDLVTDPSSVAIYRCENSEVVCYSEHRGGMNCKFK